MLQFYFLSILLNLLAGLIFIYARQDEGAGAFGSEYEEAAPFGDDAPSFDDDLSEKNPAGTGRAAGLASLAAPFLGDKTFRLVVGILSSLTGLMKLLSPIQYDIPVIGDLIPALSGLAAGAFLLLDWYQENGSVPLVLPEPVQNLYDGGRKYLGVFCGIAAVLHFIFPTVLFL